MTIRYYLVPIERSGNSRGPKYFKWRYDPDPPGIACPWSMKDYGLVDQGIVCADILAADHTTLAGKADVLTIPTNLDGKLNAAAVTAAKNYLEAVNIPAGWVSTADTYRSVLRSVCGIFFFIQRVTAIRGLTIDWVETSLAMQWQNIPASWRNAMTQAATEMGFSTVGVTATTTLRAILKNMADQWTEPVLFGLDTL